MVPSIALLVFACLQAVLAVDVIGSIVPTEGALAGVRVLPMSSDSAVVLNGGNAAKALIRADGTFTLQDVPEGDYVLSVLDRQFSFPSYSIHVASADSPVEVRPFTLGRISAAPSTVPALQYPIVIKPTSKLEYYEVPKAFSLMGMLRQNKMIVFMVLGIGAAVGLPKLLAYVDPEIMAEVQQNQAEMHRSFGQAQNMDVSGAISKLLAGGGGNDGPDTAASGSHNVGQGGARKRK